MSTASVLIVECRNDACQKDGAVDDQHNDSGRREWTTGFEIATDAKDNRFWLPVEGEDALKCPECGQLGAVYPY